MKDTESRPPVIFTWANREGSSWWLAAFIFLSFLLHSAAFFLFQGKDPISPRTIRTAPLVQIISAASDSAGRSPENDALLQWIAARDPALVAKIQTVEPKGLLNVRYFPSFQTLRTPPLGVPPEPPTIQIPPARDPLALIRSLSPGAPPVHPALAPQTTEVRLSATLDRRAPAAFTIQPTARINAPVQATVILAGVIGEGEPRFTFIQASSGDQALDAEALTFIRAVRFAPSGEALEWGTVTFEWGDEVTGAPAPK